MVERTFHCKEAELYTIARLVCQSLEQNLANFTTFKPKYSAAFVAAFQQQIIDTENLAGEQVRNEVTESLRIELKDQATLCSQNWQKLKRYIADSWPEAFQKGKTEAAGQAYYLTASNNNWDSCQQLLVYGSNFIKDNIDKLTASENMPPTFQDTFDADKLVFEQLHRSFLDSEETGTQKADAKTTANNELHGKLMGVCKDGQEIFKTKETLVKQFIFDQVLNLVSGAGIAGLNGIVTDAITGLPVAGAILTLKGTDKVAITDEEGSYSITNIAAGDYEISVEAKDYQQKTITQKVKVGTVSTLSIALDKI